MRHGTLKRFAEARGVSGQSVRDYLRGQSTTVHPIVAAELGYQPDQFEISRDSTNVDRSSKLVDRSHRLNAEAQ